MFNISKLPGSIDIGYVGETNFRTIEIDMTPWMESNPDGVPSIVCIRPKEKKADAYVAATTFENNVLSWTITAGDIGSHEGTGEIQIWLEEEENETVNKRGKSVKVKTIVHDSASDPGAEVPAAQTAVLEQMTQLKNETVSAAEDAEDAKDAAEQAAADAEAAVVHQPYIDSTSKHWMVWDSEEGEYTDTGITAEGQPGDPTQLIDDTAGEGTTGKTWSANKLDTEITDVKTAIQGIDDVLEIRKSSTKNINVTPYDKSRVNNGITYTVNDDNSVTANGTASANSRYFTDQTENIPYRFFLPAGTYTLSGGMSSSLIVGLLVYAGKNDTSSVTEYAASSTNTFTTTQDYWAVVRFYIAKNYVANNVVFKAQLEAGSEATSYVSPFGSVYLSYRLDNIEQEIDDIRDDALAYLSDTPIRLSDPAEGVVLKCESESTATITSDTVDDFDHFSATYYRTTKTEANGIKTITTTSLATHWYDGAFTMHIHGLTVGESYCIVIDTSGIELDFANYINGGYYRLYQTDETDSAYTDFYVSTPGKRIFKFTATAQTQMLKGFVYDGSHFSANNTFTKFRDIYVNRMSADIDKTNIINESHTFTGKLVIGDLPKGMTISATVTSEVYKKGVIVKKSRFAGKKLVCFGDSITSIGDLRTDYSSVIEKITGMEVINVGFGGCRMSHNSGYIDPFSMQALATAIVTDTWTDQDANVSSMVQDTNTQKHLTALKGIDWNDVDFISISYGTNDIANGVDIDDQSDKLSTSTYCGALRFALSTLLTEYPHLKVLILTPIYRYFDDSSEDSDEKVIAGHHFIDWVDALIATAKEYKIPVVDMYRTLGFNAVNRGYYYPSNDGTHPNDIGRARIGEKVSAKLLTEY